MSVMDVLVLKAAYAASTQRASMNLSLFSAPAQDARNRGFDRLVLLTTRTADWFMQRDFKLAGPAWCSELLPPSRRSQVNPARNSQLYYKNLDPLSDEEKQEPGTRIGF
jgi:amino-acid N-acetyltransferase